MKMKNGMLAFLFFLPAAVVLLMFFVYPIFLLIKDSLFTFDLNDPSLKNL
ncbi:hypothetical protein ACFQDF_26410 [Ectobacillus funiculus]